MESVTFSFVPFGIERVICARSLAILGKKEVRTIPPPTAPKDKIKAIAKTPKVNSLSASGLVQVLFMSFNLLFHCQTRERVGGADTLDEDGDQVMEQENSPNQSKDVYQKMALKLPRNAFLDSESRQNCPSGCVTYTIVSWRAALYLLHVLHDILL